LSYLSYLQRIYRHVCSFSSEYLLRNISRCHFQHPCLTLKVHIPLHVQAPHIPSQHRLAQIASTHQCLYSTCEPIPPGRTACTHDMAKMSVQSEHYPQWIHSE